MRITTPTNMTLFNRCWKLLSNPSSGLPRTKASKRQTRRLRSHSLILQPTMLITASRIAALIHQAKIRTSPPVDGVARRAKIRSSPLVDDVSRRASHDRSSYRIQSANSLQPGLERGFKVEKCPRGKLVPPLPLRRWRARRHCRHTPRNTLPSTIPQHPTGIYKERDGSEARARVPLPALTQRWRQHHLRNLTKALRLCSLRLRMKPHYRLDSSASLASSAVSK